MTFTASDVLLKAASRIEEEGMWCQGEFFLLDEEQVRVVKATGETAFGLITDWAYAIRRAGLRVPECAQGALTSAAIELGHSYLAQPAITRLNELLGTDTTVFNDSYGRTAFEVAEAMRQAAL